MIAVCFECRHTFDLAPGVTNDQAKRLPLLCQRCWEASSVVGFIEQLVLAFARRLCLRYASPPNWEPRWHDSRIPDAEWSSIRNARHVVLDAPSRCFARSRFVGPAT